MFGLTEAFRSTYLDPAKLDAHPTSIGKAIPDCQVLVLDENGEECAPERRRRAGPSRRHRDQGILARSRRTRPRCSARIRGFRARPWCSAATASTATRRAICTSSPAPTR